ncbi:MAG: hypothetical protein JO314_03510 [Acidobacteria bacterium]|nr:hypothetical protein [Acidobacteriota bacterium]
MSPSSQARLIATRSYVFIKTDSLEEGVAQEALLRNPDGGFLLYIAEQVGTSLSNERYANVGAREALIWINQPSDGLGSFWD